jgi:hypothetical protein
MTVIAKHHEHLRNFATTYHNSKFADVAASTKLSFDLEMNTNESFELFCRSVHSPECNYARSSIDGHLLDQEVVAGCAGGWVWCAGG